LSTSKRRYDSPRRAEQARQTRAAVADAARTHAGLIQRETLATTLSVHEADVESPVIELSRA